MLILNVANSTVTSSMQRCMPSINTQYYRYSKLMFTVWTYCTWRPLPDGTPANIRTYLIFLETRIIGLHFATDNMGWSSLKFLRGLHKTILFLQEWHFDHSRSSKVIDFGTKRKHVCDFILVHHSNLGPILHCFGDIADLLSSWLHPYSTIIFGCSQWTRSHMFGSMWAGTLSYSAVKLFSKHSNLCEKTYLNVTDRRTDRLTVA